MNYRDFKDKTLRCHRRCRILNGLRDPFCGDCWYHDPTDYSLQFDHIGQCMEENCTIIALCDGKTDVVVAVLLWWFNHAPHEYQLLSEQGGGEDYLAFVPDGVQVPWWIENAGGHFGICHVDEYQVKGGMVYIGGHA